MRTFWVYITAKDTDEARHIGSTIVEERLAACVNIVGAVESFYWWNNAVENEVESVLIAKTTERFLPALIERVKALHSYSCPCIEAIEVARGNPDYLAWIASETTH